MTAQTEDERGGRRHDQKEKEDEEGQDHFMVDDVEKEKTKDEENRADRRMKKKKSKREPESNYELDEEDYELLQENNIPVDRPKHSKKFKRLKKARREEESSRFSGEEEFDGTVKEGRTAEEKLKSSLFGQTLEGIAEEDEQLEEEDADISEEDEMADFIVDEEPLCRRKKLKKSRQSREISSFAFREGLEIFGGSGALLRARKLETRDRCSGSGERSLEDQFDPSVLSNIFMTEKDCRIRKIDVPERMQILEETTGDPPTDHFSIEMETEWIYNQLGRGVVPSLNKHGSTTEEVDDELKRHIAKFLELTHVQKFDVPFLAMYRKEEILSLLKNPEETEVDIDNDPNQKPNLKWHKVLWTIQDLDQKWLLLQKRRSSHRSYYMERFKEKGGRVYDETRNSRRLSKAIIKLLEAADSETKIDDVNSKFKLHFPPDEDVQSQYKRPKRKSHYASCSECGLWKVARKFGYISGQFWLQISRGRLRWNDLEDAKEIPEEMASNCTCIKFETPQEVLEGARHMASVEISCEPFVRTHVRSIFMDNAVVSTGPMLHGEGAIDSSHQFAEVQCLWNKPLTSFGDGQWLLIQKAEEEKLLDVRIELPKVALEELVNGANCMINGASESAQLWNEQRKQILQDALKNYLLPSMEKEARSLLSSRAKAWLLSEYGKRLWDKVSVAPYQQKENKIVNDLKSDEETAPRVMACCWGPGKPATTFVMLDSFGEFLDVLHADSLNSHGQNVEGQIRKRNDQQRVKNFMKKYQPHVVVLGVANLSCPRLKQDIYEIFKMVEDNCRDVVHDLNIVYGDETLPRLYENSPIATDQLPSQEGIIRRAVALGRYLQNPLAMVATLCGPNREILSWKFDPLENFLSPDEKYGMVEQIMVDATNQVGLDLNLASRHKWLFAPLQFISGLGPRKAVSLQASLVRARTIFTRENLLTSHGLDEKVYNNAAGFLQVRRSGSTSRGSQFIGLLDGTRIHPESYSLVQDILLKYMNCEDVNDDVLKMAMVYARANPHEMWELAVREGKKNHNKKETHIDIRSELLEGFQDKRRLYVEPSLAEFFMIPGETEEALSEGRIVQATVCNVESERAICVLESGSTGVLYKKDYSDFWRGIQRLHDKLHEGDILTCKIKSILKGQCPLLTCRESEMRNNVLHNINRYCHREEELAGHRKVNPYFHREKEPAKNGFVRRIIFHPCFENITADEAIKFLEDKCPGANIIHPSSHGPLHLTLTLKVYKGVYARKFIKEHEENIRLFRHGKDLTIEEDTFEDLDEVKCRYVDPLVRHLETMLSYRKFREGTKTEVDELLRIEKSENPMMIVYSFGISHEHPLMFILTYIRNTNPHHEHIYLCPKGFKFRKRMFKDIDHLVAYFQRHIDDPPDSAQSIQYVATRGSAGFDSASHTRGRSRSGRGYYRNGDGHPSGAPRPYGGRGGGGDSHDSNQSSQKWGPKDVVTGPPTLAQPGLAGPVCGVGGPAPGMMQPQISRPPQISVPPMSYPLQLLVVRPLAVAPPPGGFLPRPGMLMPPIVQFRPAVPPPGGFAPLPQFGQRPQMVAPPQMMRGPQPPGGPPRPGMPGGPPTGQQPPRPGMPPPPPHGGQLFGPPRPGMPMPPPLEFRRAVPPLGGFAPLPQFGQRPQMVAPPQMMRGPPRPGMPGCPPTGQQPPRPGMPPPPPRGGQSFGPPRPGMPPPPNAPQNQWGKCLGISQVGLLDCYEDHLRKCFG